MITLFSLMIAPHKTAQIIPFSGVISTKAEKSYVIFSLFFFLLDSIPGATNILCFQLRLIRGVEERRTREGDASFFLEIRYARKEMCSLKFFSFEIKISRLFPISFSTVISWGVGVGVVKIMFLYDGSKADWNFQNGTWMGPLQFFYVVDFWIPIWLGMSVKENRNIRK